MKFACAILVSLTACSALADQRLGKWCESDDQGKTCVGYISYFPNNEVYAYGVTEDVFYIATGSWQQRGQESCLSLTYKLFDPFTETPYPPEEFNFCNQISAIDEQTFVYLDDAGESNTMYRVSQQPDYRMQPLPDYLALHAERVKPEVLTLNPPAGKYGLYPLILETVPADFTFKLSLSPHAELDPQWYPYTYVQIGDPEQANFRISLHQQPGTTGQNILMLEYRVGGKATKQQLAMDIADGEPVLIRLAWLQDGTTTITYQDKSIQHILPLTNWQSYFMASSTNASFQRVINKAVP